MPVEMNKKQNTHIHWENAQTNP